MDSKRFARALADAHQHTSVNLTFNKGTVTYTVLIDGGLATAEVFLDRAKAPTKNTETVSTDTLSLAEALQHAEETTIRYALSTYTIEIASAEVPLRRRVSGEHVRRKAVEQRYTVDSESSDYIESAAQQSDSRLAVVDGDLVVLTADAVYTAALVRGYPDTVIPDSMKPLFLAHLRCPESQVHWSEGRHYVEAGDSQMSLPVLTHTPTLGTFKAMAKALRHDRLTGEAVEGHSDQWSVLNGKYGTVSTDGTRSVLEYHR